MRQIKKGSTSQSVYFEVLDSTSGTGGRKTGLVYNSSGLTAYYARNQNTSTSITLATLAAANTAWATGGFKEVDATNMPGIYRLDVPDAAFATGADTAVVTIRGVTGMAQVSLEIQLVDNVVADVPTANQNADALLDRSAGVETNRTLRQGMRLMLAALLGKASGLAGTTATYRDTNDAKDRIVATVDADGNRSAVTLDAS